MLVRGPDPRQQVVAALSVVAPSAGFEAATYGLAVQAAARAVSRQLAAGNPADLPLT